MIGINLSCASFCGACWACVIYCKIKSLTAEIIFADENLIHRLYIGFEGLLSQMNNFLDDVHPKYLCAKTRDVRLAHGYFHKAHSLTTPIMLNETYAQ